MRVRPRLCIPSAVNRTAGGRASRRSEAAAMRSGDVEAPDNYENHQEEKEAQGSLVFVVFAVLGERETSRGNFGLVKG